MPSSIFNGTAVKILKNILRFKDGTELTSTQVSDYLASKTDLDDPTGFVNQTDSTISFANANRRLTIAPAAGSFEYYVKGVKYTKSGTETIDISADEGIHYIYYDGDTLAETTTFTPSLLCDYALVAFVHWDATNSAQIYFADERHGAQMSCKTHEYLHQTLGAILESGGALGDILADESGALAAHAEFSNAATVLWDEDIKISHTARTSVTNIPVYYRSGLDASGIWRMDESASFGVLATGTGRAAYNQNNAGTWQLTEVTNGDFVLAHVIVYNDTSRKFGVVMGQDTYGTAGQARDGAITEISNLFLQGSPTAEYKFLGTIIYQTSNAYGNAVKSRIRSTDTRDDYVDLRDEPITRSGVSTTVNNHGGLSGLSDDDHSQYALLAGRTGDALLIDTITEKTGSNGVQVENVKLSGGNIDTLSATTMTIAASAGANNVTVGGSTSTVVVPGNLQVQGTTTSVDTTNLDVVDANITVNNGGNQASADTQDAGFTVEMSDATDAAIGYDSTTTSKFLCGEVGSLVELATISHAQIFTNKSIDSDNNTITNIANADIKAAAAIAVNKLAAATASRALVSDGSGFLSAATTTATEIGYINGLTSAVQTQLNSKAAIADIFNITASSGTFGAVANATHLVDVSAATSAVTLPAVAADIFVRIKDKLGSANTYNITVTPASGTIDGAATDVIDSNFGSVVYVSDGTNWFKL